MDRQFKLHWRCGDTTIVNGEDLASAMNNANFGQGVLAAIDYHEEIKKATVLKTAVIWNEFNLIKYCIVDGDWSEFEGVFINSVWRHKEAGEESGLNEHNKKLRKRLRNLAYNDEYFFKLISISKKEFAQEIRLGAEIVECGFIPSADMR